MGCTSSVPHASNKPIAAKDSSSGGPFGASGTTLDTTVSWDANGSSRRNAHHEQDGHNTFPDEYLSDKDDASFDGNFCKYLILFHYKCRHL